MADTNPQQNKQMTVIGPEAEFRGQLSCRGPARIMGLFEGEITSESEVHVGEGAECRASIQAARIIVDGAMDGDLTASDRVQLGAKAQVRGDLVAGALIVSEGASFCGHCTVGPEIAITPTSNERPAAKPRVETRSVKPSAPAASTRAGATPAHANSLAAATADLENDPEWQSLSQ